MTHEEKRRERRLQSDNDLAAHVADALSGRPDLNVGRMLVFVANGEVILGGAASSSLSARHAVELAEGAAAGHAVRSALRIASGRYPSYPH